MNRFAVARWGLVILALIALTVAGQRWLARLRAGTRALDRAAMVSPREPANAPPPAPAPPALSPPASPAPASGAAPASAEVDPYGMPPPSPDQIRPVPAPPVITPADHRATQAAARELVEHSIARLEKEGQAAAQAGDPETAQRNALRVARLRKRLATLNQEAAQDSQAPQDPRAPQTPRVPQDSQAPSAPQGAPSP